MCLISLSKQIWLVASRLIHFDSSGDLDDEVDETPASYEKRRIDLKEKQIPTWLTSAVSGDSSRAEYLPRATALTSLRAASADCNAICRVLDYRLVLPGGTSYSLYRRFVH